jgi:hypothetical protein
MNKSKQSGASMDISQSQQHLPPKKPMIGSTIDSHNMKKVNKYLGVLGLPKLGSSPSPHIEK